MGGGRLSWPQPPAAQLTARPGTLLQAFIPATPGLLTSPHQASRIMGGNGIAQWLQFGAFWRGKAELLAQLKVTARKLLSNLMEYENVMFKSVLPTCFLSNGIVIKNRDQRRKQVILSLTIILSPAITDAVTHTPICHPGQKQSLKHLEWLTLITAPLHPASPPTGTQVPSAHHQHEWVRRLCFLPGNMSQVSGTAAVAYWN